MSQDDVSDGPAGPDADAPPSLDEMFYSTLYETFAAEGEEPTDERVSEIIGKVLPELLPRFAESFAETIVAMAPDILPDRRADRARFEEALRSAWGDALDLLEVVIGVFYEFGQKHLEDAIRDNPGDIRTEALIQLHARAVRTATEVLRLLESGLADGALARCRSLHEIAVVVVILSQSVPEVSERYLLHEIHHARKTMKKLQEHAPALGWKPVTDAEMDALDRRVAELQARFGKQYVKQEFGWAAGVIQKKGDIRFVDLEKAAQLEKFRPFFSWASDSVHAGSHGLQSLGMPHYLGRRLYAGGSSSGLMDPGQHAVLSIGQITGAMALHCTTLQAAVSARALLHLTRRCQDALQEAHIGSEAQTQANVAREIKEARRKKRSG